MPDPQSLTASLKGRWQGSYGMARCPAHEDRTPSLSIRKGDNCDILVKCHAGCEQGDVIDAIRARGLWPTSEKAHFTRKRSLKPDHRQSQTQNQNKDSAVAIWKKASPADGTAVERYLRGRGITIASSTLRFAYLKHGPTGLTFPTMVAAVEDKAGDVIAVHRTFLRTSMDGVYKANVSSPKMALGSIAGGAVRLSPADDTVILVEGIEDALALHQMTGVPTWAVLGTAGFGNVELPETVRKVLLAPDMDDAGNKAIEAANRNLRGRDVRFIQPPHGDWCDVLEQYEERAAFQQYSGELAREEAETAAWMEIFNDLES